MKRIFYKMFPNAKAFTLLEVLVSMALIGIIGVLIFSIQTSSWKRVTSSNRTLVAGHMIEKQIEAMRMNISRDQNHNFPPVSGSVTNNGVTLKWQISDALRPKDSTTHLTNVKQCDFTASWGNGKSDTLRATTYLSKMF